MTTAPRYHAETFYGSGKTLCSNGNPNRRFSSCVAFANSEDKVDCLRCRAAIAKSKTLEKRSGQS